MSLLTNWLESLSYDLNIADQCLRKISPFSSCTSCQESCEQQAITLKKGLPFIVHDNCNKCGRCIPVCPVQAMEGQGPTRKTMHGVLVLDEKPLPTVPELLYLYTCGIRKISNSISGTESEAIIEETNARLKKMDREPFTFVPYRTPDSQDEPFLSRRDFFNRLSSQGKKLAFSTVTPVKWRFNQGKYRTSTLFDGWSFYEVMLNLETCSLCETCFRLCPADVFSVAGNQLSIDHEKCSGCSLCTDVCSEEGIKVEAKVHHSVIELIPLVKNKCQTCGGDFLSWTGTEDCSICDHRKKNNFLF